MEKSEWEKVDFKEFVKTCGIDHLVNNAPDLLYSKKDKEHLAINSLIYFTIVAIGLVSYVIIAILYLLFLIYFSVVFFFIVIIILTAIDLFLFNNYFKSRVFIKPIECWIEIYKGLSQKNYDFYCFMYYPIFSGKCNPNNARDVIFKLYQEEVLKDKIDITQIEFYIKIDQNNALKHEKIGWHFPYGRETSFKDENLSFSRWKFFNHEKPKNENYIVTANWQHHYEWRDELTKDSNKLIKYGPWAIQTWTKEYLKPLTEEYKKNLKWKLRYIESTPKLKPWRDDLEKQTYNNPKIHHDTQIIDEAIEKIVGKEYHVESVQDIRDDLLKLKSYFRDLNFE